ncbi:MAG TPA: T9SS type A sorting domain-containing protein [Ignavibacteria bacterium]|nr:T9SS type A sorting domain-containing protein [Ignavibacteria bacterium]
MKKYLLILQSVLFIMLIYLFSTNRTFLADSENVNENNSETGPGFVPAEEWFAKQRAFPFDEIPQDEYLKSVNYVKENMNYIETDDPSSWGYAGPVNIEGRITTVAIHPSDPHTVYAGTANGGLWKSTDFCQNWVPVFDGQNTSSIGAIAIDPVNPEIIYCGTGEPNSLRSYYPGTGIYKSTNGGTNWIFSGLDSSYTIGNISVNPLNSQVVYAAAGGWTRRKNSQRGIYRSLNGGLTWEKKFYLSDSVGAIDVKTDPQNPNKVFAAMWERQRREDYVKYGGTYSGMYVSTDSGNNWSQISGGFPVNDATLGRISFDISKSDPQTIYALTAYTSGASRGLYRSTNGGENWININSSAAQSSSYAWFNRICSIDPINPNRLFCGGLQMEFSGNGGLSFGISGTSHVDQHAAAFSLSDPNYIVLGNDGGIDYSTNGGSSWNESRSLPITQFYAGEIYYNNPDRILGGTQDNGTIRTSAVSGVWDEIYGGDGFYCLVDYSNGQNVFAASQFGGLGRSTNGGNSFLGATNGLDLTYTNWMTPYVMDKNNPQILYCGTYKIHKTTDGMQSWNAISPDLTNGHVQSLGSITTVDAARSDPGVIYCGTDDANVWVTTNGGNNWTKINNGLPRRWVTRVAVHPDSANVCYVTLSGYKVDSTGSHIFRTTNFGNAWTSISGNLPDAPINDVIIDPVNTNSLIIGTDINVMITHDLGSEWSILSSGIPSNVPCQDLTFHAPSRTLVAWTHGRGAFKILIPLTNIQNINNIISQSFELSQNYPNPFNPGTNIDFEILNFGFVSLKIYDVLGNEVETLISENKSAGRYSIQWNGSGYASGVYYYEMSAGDFSEVKKMVLIK